MFHWSVPSRRGLVAGGRFLPRTRIMTPSAVDVKHLVNYLVSTERNACLGSHRLCTLNSRFELER